MRKVALALLFVAAARNLAAKCMANTYAQTAVMQNTGTAGGPKDS